ncbi:MAG TPA: tetratricopeptide repeat protein, partial [Longimicrobiales bacterium]
DAPELEEWIAQQRLRFANAYAGALEHVATVAGASADWMVAVEWWQKRAAQDPLDTRVALSLIQALDAAGSRASALQHAALHERLLQDELGLIAPAELTAAVEQLRREPAPRRQPSAVSEPRQSHPPGPEVPVPARSAPHPHLRISIAAAALLVVSVALGTFVWRPPHGKSEAPIAMAATQNSEAYKLYLRGRYFWNKRTEKDIERALEYYGQAVDMDPGYALAWAGIADAWIFRGWYAQFAPRETFPKAKHAALRALEFDSALAAAHASLAHVYFRFEHDWPAAEREYRRAIQLDPDNSVAHHWYGGFLSVMGRNAEAFAQADTAVTLDPLAPIIQTWQGLHHYFARQYDDAIVEYRKAIRLSDDFAPAHWHLSWALLELHRYPEAVAEARRAASDDPGNVLYQAAVGYAYARAGMADDARVLLARLMKTAKTQYVSAYDIALIHSALGEKGEALDWLERAYAERAVMIPYLRVDPRLDPVRSDARFEQLLRSARLDF